MGIGIYCQASHEISTVSKIKPPSFLYEKSELVELHFVIRVISFCVSRRETQNEIARNHI